MAKNTIKIKNYLSVMEEYLAGGTITPGHLIKQSSATQVVVHSTAGGNVLPMFACEDELQGKGITDNYAATNIVQCWIPTRGDIVYAKLADGQNVAAGTFLESAGDGTLQAHVPDIDASNDVTTIYASSIVGVAIEAVDMSGSAGADPSGRIQVRII